MASAIQWPMKPAQVPASGNQPRYAPQAIAAGADHGAKTGNDADQKSKQVKHHVPSIGRRIGGGRAAKSRPAIRLTRR